MEFNKINKRVTAILLSLCLMPLDNSMPVAASGKPAVTKSITITQGEKKAIKIKGVFIKSKSFKSSNKKIATVNKKGIVTAVSKGKCKVKVTVKYYKNKKCFKERIYYKNHSKRKEKAKGNNYARSNYSSRSNHSSRGNYSSRSDIHTRSNGCTSGNSHFRGNSSTRTNGYTRSGRQPGSDGYT